ncbi:VCAN [Branchiostoma lanceolatum]|uniref:VCAN protein n=1 Tax=Branchiostoma lanceolatum TaxID=7740 RepID=A0A8J9ZBY2_BRALA|nr:VCAN [Branchiostoma lanceolatum]
MIISSRYFHISYTSFEVLQLEIKPGGCTENFRMANVAIIITVMCLIAAGAVEVSAQDGNIALRRRTAQSSTYGGAAAGRAVDGNVNPNWRGNSCTHTNRDYNPWWLVDLGRSQSVGKVVVTNRKDCCSNRLEGFRVYVGNSANVLSNPTCGGAQYPRGRPEITVNCGGRTGRYVGIALRGKREYLTLCEVKVYGGDGYVKGPNGRNMYKLHTDKMMPYEGARKACWDEGAHLADVKTEKLHDFLVSQIKTTKPGDYWIGANDINAEKKWKWSDKTELKYTNWYPGQPDNSGGNQDCGLMWHQGYKWDDQNCNIPKFFICEKSG